MDNNLKKNKKNLETSFIPTNNNYKHYIFNSEHDNDVIDLINFNDFENSTNSNPNPNHNPINKPINNLKKKAFKKTKEF